MHQPKQLVNEDVFTISVLDNTEIITGLNPPHVN